MAAASCPQSGISVLSIVLLGCWLADRKGIQPVEVPQQFPKFADGCQAFDTAARCHYPRP